MNMHSTPRNSKRRPLRLMVKSRVESRAINVDMIDISEGGCKIRGTPGFANVGDRGHHEGGRSACSRRQDCLG